jgi:hypothetical protein
MSRYNYNEQKNNKPKIKTLYVPLIIKLFLFRLEDSFYMTISRVLHVN